MSSLKNAPLHQVPKTEPKAHLRALALTLLISITLPLLIILLTNTINELKVQWQQQQPLEVVTLVLALACLAFGICILLWWLLNILGYLSLLARKGFKTPLNQSSSALFRFTPKTLKRLLGLSVSTSIALSLSGPSFAANPQDVPANLSTTHSHGLSSGIAGVSGGPQLLLSGAHAKMVPELRLGATLAANELTLNAPKENQNDEPELVSVIATIQDQQLQHVVTPGESLWSIAKGQLQSSENVISDDQVLDYVMEIITLNKERIPEPNVITPGQVITLPNLVPTSN